MSDTVWTIEFGEYSDYAVHAIFSTRERAAEMLDNFGIEWTDDEDRGYTVRIVERPLNPRVELMQLNHDLWKVCMGRDGSVEKLEQVRRPNLWDLFGSEMCVYDKKIIGKVVAPSSKHAVKIANEFRAQAIADGRLK